MLRSSVPSSGVSALPLWCAGLLLAAMLAAGSAAADALRVHGRVVDAEGRPVAGVEVDIPAHRVRTLTGADGTFELQIPPGDVQWVLRRAGFETWSGPVSPVAEAGLEFRLQFRERRTAPIVVQAERRRPPAPPAGR